MSGKHPFFGPGCENQATVKYRIVHENPPTDQEEWYNFLIVLTHFVVRKAVSSHAIHLVKWMLQKDPRKRCSAKEALNHVWFK